MLRIYVYEQILFFLHQSFFDERDIIHTWR